MAALPNLTAVQLALRARLFTLATLPALVSWENVLFQPVPGQPFVAEQFVPGPATLRGLTAGGLVETRGLYVVQWYVPSNTGLGALTAGADAVLALFPPESTLTTTTGDVVRIRGDAAPYRGQLRTDPTAGLTGFAFLPVTIPWLVYTST